MYSTLIPKDKKIKFFNLLSLKKNLYIFNFYVSGKTNKKIDDSEVAIEFEISDFIVNF